MDVTIRHDEAGHRFVAALEGGEAVVEYQPAGEGVLDFTHTFVPDTLRGRRVGTQLVLHALEHARAHGQRVVPSCWFVKLVVERHPELAAVVAG